MYGLLTGELYSQGQVIVDGSLPEGLGHVVLRALIANRADSYKSLPFLLADLRLLQTLVEHERKEMVHWEDFELPADRPPVWEELGLVRFALRSARMAVRSVRDVFLRQSRIARVAEAALLTVLLCVMGSRALHPTHSAGVYKKVGPTMYVAEGGGLLEAWSTSGRQSVAWMKVGDGAGDVLLSPRLGRLCVTIPGEKVIESYDDENLTKKGTTKVPAGADRLYIQGNGASALCLSSSGVVSTLNLRTLSVNRLNLEARATDVTADPHSGLVYVAQSNPPSVVACYPLDNRILYEHDLAKKPRLIRATPDGEELWVLPDTVEGEIEVLDPKTLAVKTTVQLGTGRPSDIVFGPGKAYLLDQANSDLLTVDRKTYKLIGAGFAVGRQPLCMAMAGPDQMWIGCADKSVTVVDLKTSSTTRLQTRGVPHALVFSP
jgi:DNA-binding beta-propeller fold protein YncE